MKKIIIIVLCVYAYTLPSTSQEVGSTAPDFELTSASDSQFKLSEQHGKVVVIFIFGYDCPFCISFAPTSDTKLNQEYANREDFVMVGIDSWNGSKTGVQSFRSKTGVSYPLLLNGGDVAKSYETTYDRLLVVDKEGILRHSNPNTVAKNDLEAVLTVVDEYIETSVATSFNTPHADSYDFSVYPNPVIHKLSVQANSNKDEIIGIKVFDLTGKTVISQQFNDSRNQVNIDMSGLPESMYYLQIKGENFSETKKFMKK